ncbi:dienelactone hydrolase family protein [Naasia lichenicola]|uniref:dienelactone hydrolase family protein n=1 Tax=Naasia lichenicola TaxID=2565933 RepID=UPI0018EE83A9|nr:dienelactone hydrolase family protein [Naasia lichenicola]
MATIVLFHSVLGVRQGERDASARLSAEGHTVLVPDLYDGPVFDSYKRAMGFASVLGDEKLGGRALAAVADLPDGFIVGGFSQGSSVAYGVATQRRVGALLQFAGVNLLEWFGADAALPAGLDGQAHFMTDDSFREPQFEEQAIADVAKGGGRLEVFEYPGTGHLFTDPTLPDEYDAEATELMWSRVLPFVAAH